MPARLSHHTCSQHTTSLTPAGTLSWSRALRETAAERASVGGGPRSSEGGGGGIVGGARAKPWIASVASGGSAARAAAARGRAHADVEHHAAEHGADEPAQRDDRAVPQRRDDRSSKKPSPIANAGPNVEKPITHAAYAA